MEQLKTNWESIGLSNDFLFGKIMRKPALCKRMLEIILGVKIDRLEYLESQKSIDEEWDARSIRLDIYVQDNREIAYNIEIQTTNTGDLPKRSRYYQSVLDMHSIEAEEAFEAYIAGQKNKKYDSMKAATQEDMNQAAVQCTEQKNKPAYSSKSRSTSPSSP